MKIISILFALFPFLTIFAQSSDSTSVSYMDYNNPQDYILADVTITGVKYLQPAYLVNISGLSIGQEISIPGDAITKAIDKFWEFGLFSDVKVYLVKTEGRKAFLEIELTEQPRLTKARIHGVNKTETSDLEELIKLKPGSQITDNVINNAKTAIRKHYEEKAFYNCDIKVVQKADTNALNKVYLDIYVNKKSKVRISDILFEDNTAFSDARLRKTMKKTKRVSPNIFKPSKYIEKDYREDKNKLLAFYNENGYRDAKIISETIEPTAHNRIGIKFQMEEGVQYYINTIQWVGNTKYPAEILNRVTGINKGDIYDQNHLQERLFSNEDAITSLYMDEGYLFFSVDPVELKILDDTVTGPPEVKGIVNKVRDFFRSSSAKMVNREIKTVDLQMRISEGSPATVNRVIIKGNTKTNEHVVRRELRTRPGELFSKSDIIRSVRELATLGHFNPENISPNPIPNPSDGTVDLEYGLEERANDQLEVSGGWGGYGFVGTVGIRFSNFSVRNILDLKAWRPVPTGDGQSLSIRAQSNGKYYQSYNLSFVEPWFGGKKPNNFSFSIYHQASRYPGNRSASTKDDYFKVYGASIGLGKRLKWPDDYFMLYTELGYQRYQLNDWSSFFMSTGHSNILSLRINITRSSQDQMIYPRKGSVFSLGLQITPPYSLFSNSDAWKLTDAERLDIRNDTSWWEGSRRVTDADKDAEIASRRGHKNTNGLNFINGLSAATGIPA